METEKEESGIGDYKAYGKYGVHLIDVSVESGIKTFMVEKVFWVCSYSAQFRELLTGCEMPTSRSVVPVEDGGYLYERIYYARETDTETLWVAWRLKDVVEQDEEAKKTFNTPDEAIEFLTS